MRVPMGVVRSGNLRRVAEGWVCCKRERRREHWVVLPDLSRPSITMKGARFGIGVWWDGYLG